MTHRPTPPSSTPLGRSGVLAQGCTSGRGQQGRLPLLLHAQAWWDAQRFDQPVWQIAAWRDQKVRHIQLHVAKALGKAVAASSREAAGASGAAALARVRDEVLPDVAIYRSQLRN